MPLDYSNLDILLQQANLAEGLEKEELTKIGDIVVRDFEYDLQSRSVWETMYADWMKLAIQVIEEKTFPWRNAANVKYPLLSTAAMQFQARAYPTLVSGNVIVKARVIGEDPDGSKLRRAERIGKHMTYQLLEEMPNWDEDMDKACFILPIVGTIFKKVYYDPDKGYNCSELVLPRDLVINYWAKTLEDCETKTHILYMSKNKVKENQLSGNFLEFDIAAATTKEFDHSKKVKENTGLSEPASSENSPLTILEQHRLYDLDNDGYQEPYIVTVEYSTRTVLRITPRFQKSGVITSEGKIVKITPDEYFIKFPFIPNPDGGFYDLGFGALLGPLNETVNTLINQLIDSGTINNLQSGFIAKGVRMKMDDAALEPGEWRTVQTTGDDLRKGILPLPSKEPSSALFQLLGTIVESGEKLASVAEIFVGKMPGQNTPATTTMATIEQGMKVFTAIYKRIYRSLTKEFRKLYKLNQLYLPFEKEFEILDSQELISIKLSDYQQDDTDVKPAADPNVVSEMLRMTKAQALLELIPLGTVNPQEVTRRVLEAQEQPEIEKLLNAGPPPPDPKMLEIQAKMQAEEAKTNLKMQESQIKMMMDQQMGKMDMQLKQMDLQFKSMEAQLKLATQKHQMIIDMSKAEQDLKIEQVTGNQKMQLKEQEFKMKEKQIEQKSKETDIKKPKNRKIKQISDNEYEVEES